MRDYAFLGLLLVLLPVALFRPWIGVLAWTWISLMNPHEYTWVAATMPVAAAVGGATLVGTLLTRDPIRFPFTSETLFLILFMLWITATYPLYFFPGSSFEMWSRVMKIDLMILVTLALLHSQRQINLFVWVVVISLGFYGVKGGIFTIATGGAHRVWGPGGFIGGNNEVALALIVVIPLMRYLQLEAQRKWARVCWTAAIVLTAAAALGSYSRGALLAIVAMAIFLWIKSPKKLVFGISILIIGAFLAASMTESWDARMGTIQNYEDDASAMGRINAWWMAWNLAKDNFAGGGFDIYLPEVFAKYAPDPLLSLAAHSIYFQVLGEHGFVGLALYLAMWISAWRSAGWLSRNAGKSDDTRWCGHLGAMCQVSLVGYAVGGAFLSLAYFDLPYDVLAAVVLTKRWLLQRLPSPEYAANSTPDPTKRSVADPQAGH